MSSSQKQTAPQPPPLSPHQSRVLGALLGVHAGDSLGATVEFKSHAMIKKKYPSGLREIIGGGPFQWPPGHATDDTDMTRAVVLAYLAKKPGQDIARLAGDNFIDWYEGRWPNRVPGLEPKDIGGATRRGLGKYLETRDPDDAGAGQGSAGNGSLMRCIPTGLFQKDPESRVTESIRISKVTHDDYRCTGACAAYNAIVADLIIGRSPATAVQAGEDVAQRLEFNRGGGRLVKAIQLGRVLKIDKMARDGPAPQLEDQGGGYVLDTLTIAIAAVLDERPLEDVLVDVVRIGRDTDTNGAVAGGLLGARDGHHAIPRRWREKLQFGKEFREATVKLVKI